MSAVEDFIYQFGGTQRAVLLYFHELFTEELGLECKIRYRIPFYYGRSWICYLNPVKGEQIEWALIRGNELSNEQGLLQSRGRKQVMGAVFGKEADIPQDMVFEIMQEALLLDETTTYAAKRKSK